VWLEDPADRAPLRGWLDRHAIETKSYYNIAIPDLTAFQGRVASADRSRELARRSFAVPIHTGLLDVQVDRIASTVRQFFEGRR
jgi:dTDP-4-amino-4,6-dideoxygalactose transaminase